MTNTRLRTSSYSLPHKQGSDEVGEVFRRLVNADLPALRQLGLKHTKIVSDEWKTMGTWMTAWIRIPCAYLLDRRTRPTTHNTNGSGQAEGPVRHRPGARPQEALPQPQAQEARCPGESFFMCVV